MTDVKTWSETAATNNQVPPDGFPELMSRSDVNNAAREAMRAIRKFYAAAEWVNVYSTVGDAWLAADSDATHVILTPDDGQTAEDIGSRFPTGSRCKIVTDTPSTQYGFVVGTALSTDDTIIEVEIDDAAAVDTGANMTFEISLMRDSLEKTAYYPTGATTGQFPPQVPTIDDLGDGATLDMGAGEGFNADTVDGQHAAQIIATAAGSSSRNTIYNAEFMVWQRGSPIDAVTTGGRTNVNDDGNYCADRWVLLSGDSTNDVNDVADVSKATSDPPAGFYSNLKLETQGSPVGQSFMGIFQILDSKDSAQFIASGSISINAWLRGSANINGAVIRVLGWTGLEDIPTRDPISDWGSAGSDPTLVTSWTSMIDSGILTVTTDWGEFKTEDEDISAHTTVKNIGILITTDEAAITGGDTLEITGVQIENGDTSTAFGHRDYGTELRRCERYYTNSFDDGQDPANAVGELGAVFLSSINRNEVGSDNLGASFVYPIQMRTIPTILIYNSTNDTDESFYEQRGGTDVLESTVTKTVTDRRVNWSLEKLEWGTIMSAHVQADAEF